MKSYFLSYARLDEPLALRVANDLIAAGVSLWVDKYDIRPSQHWDQAIETAVRGCEGLVVLLSPRSAASPNVADEVSVALNEGKDVIPIMIEPCTPPLRMTRMNFIDATSDRALALRRCLAAITKARPAMAAQEDRTFGQPAPASALPAEVLRTAELRLLGVMGPISGVLVRNAAARADSETALYQELARSIPSDTERQGFLDWLTEPAAPPPPASPDPGLSAEDLEAITKALARQLGPIARQLVRRETSDVRSKADLCRRLAARIDRDQDRAAFFKDVGAG